MQLQAKLDLSDDETEKLSQILSPNRMHCPTSLQIMQVQHYANMLICTWDRRFLDAVRTFLSIASFFWCNMYLVMPCQMSSQISRTLFQTTSGESRH